MPAAHVWWHLASAGGGRLSHKVYIMSGIRPGIASKAYAAFRLGFFTRCLQPEVLLEVLPVLSDVMKPTEFLGLQQAVQLLGPHYEQALRFKNANQSPIANPAIITELSGIPGSFSFLISLADRAITPANPIRCLYDLGTALGDYLLQQHFGRTASDASLVLEQVRSLPAWCLEGASTLRELAERSSDSQNLDQTLEKISLGTEFRPEEIVPNEPVDSPKWPAAVRFAGAVSRELVSMSIAGADGDSTGWDPATEARNKWIYEECRKGTGYPQIIRALGKKSQAERWDPIESTNGIKKARDEYIKRKGLTPLPARHRGRPSKKK